MSAVNRFIYGVLDAPMLDGTGLQPDPELTARNLKRARKIIRRMGSKWCMYNPRALKEFVCPYCGTEHHSPNGTGSDIKCCGEVGHCGRIDEYDAREDQEQELAAQSHTEEE